MDAIVCDAVRTPIGRYGGALSSVRTDDLAAVPIAAPVAGDSKWNIPIQVIHSNQDQVVSYSAAQRHADSIRSAGGSVEFRTARGLSHYDMGSYRIEFANAIDAIRAGW